MNAGLPLPSARRDHLYVVQAALGSTVLHRHVSSTSAAPASNFPNEVPIGGNQVNRTLFAVCCIALSSIPVLAQKKTAEAPAMTDQQFIDFAAQTDMVEANLGQLAQTAASSQPVKDYGQMLVTDHTKDYNQLYDVAHQANLNMPNAIDAEHNKAMIDPFQKLKDAAFDHHYAQEMVAGHTKAIAVYKKEAADAQNPALKSYATDALPVLEKHLDGAKALEKSKASKSM
jgi:putative membrane protein